MRPVSDSSTIYVRKCSGQNEGFGSNARLKYLNFHKIYRILFSENILEKTEVLTR